MASVPVAIILQPSAGTGLRVRRALPDATAEAPRQGSRCMGAGPKHKTATVTPDEGGEHARILRGLIAELSLEALQFVPRNRIEQTARQWLARSGLAEDDPRGVLALADALGLASELALFTPSPSGATAIDRLLRSRPKLDGHEAAAAEALRRAQFRLGRVEAQEGEGTYRLRDLASGEVLHVLDDSM